MAKYGLAALVFLIAGCMTTANPTISTQSQETTIPRGITLESEPLSHIQVYRQISYGKTKLLEQCMEQPSVLWCADYRQETSPLSQNLIHAADSLVRKNWTYLSDEHDTWRVHTSTVLNNQIWLGDCDDIATTTLEVLARAGQPRDKMWLVLVAAQLSYRIQGRLDHLVAIVQDSEGEFWVVGDTNGKVYRLSDMTYRPIVYTDMNTLDWKSAESADYRKLFVASSASAIAV